MLCFVLAAKSNSYAGNADSSLVLSLDPPAHEGNGIIQRLNYKASIPGKVNIRLRSYLQTGKDSLALYDLEFKQIGLSEGLGSVNLNFNSNSTVHQADYKFQEILKRFEVLPPGDYVTYLHLSFSDTSLIIIEKFNWYVDSALSPFSPLRRDVNKTLASGSVSGKTLFKKVAKPQVLNEVQAASLNSKIDRKVARKNDVVLKPFKKNGERQTGFYYRGWFLGYYDLIAAPVLKERIKRENSLLANNPLELVTSDLEGFTSLSSQTKKANRKENNNEVTGNIDFLNNLSTGRETGSQQDRNFQELYGNFNTEVMKVPVIVEGYYTTQDNKRRAKASYLRISYDVEKNKSELTKAAGDFTGKHELAQSRGMGYKSVYEQMIGRMVSEQAADRVSFEKEYGISADLLNKYNGDVVKMISEIDTTEMLKKGAGTADGSDVEDTKEKLAKNQQKLKDHYQKSEDTRKKIDKYSTLLEQYEKQQYFDSAMSYAKIKDAVNTNASQKQLAKAAEHILPAGKSSSFLNSLTRFEVGILNSYESDYTMSGQVLKGGSVGYDLGAVTVGGAVGKTEYISRDGSVDKYNTTMVRADLHPTLRRKIGLVYYTCSPTKQIISDNEFFKSDAGLPSFKQPVNILSIPYEFTVTKDLSITGEGAVSYRRFEHLTKIGNHNTAYKTGITYTIPAVNLATTAEWEHVGRDFENAAMPFPKAATDRYTIGTKALLFKAFLTAGVQFNYLKQETFSTSGRNIKWGFDVRTHSKRYPELYLSYKPFSTFRSYDDTLAIAQRPMIGSVSVGRISYQMKRKGVAHRFMLTYNRNSSIQEDISYNSTTIQATYLFSSQMNMVNLTAGWMAQPQFLPGVKGSTSSYIGSVSYSRVLNEYLTGTAGQDIALAPFGLQRSATMLGMAYSFKNKPVSIRLMGRYNAFRANELTTNENIWSCVMACSWQIRPSQKNGKTN